MRRAGLLYIAAGVLGIAAFFLPASGSSSLFNIVRGVEAIHDRLEALDFLPVNLVLRLIQAVIVMIVLLGINFVMFGLQMVRQRVDNPDRPLVTIAAWIGLVVPMYSLYMHWPAPPSIAEIVFFAAGALALAAGYIADKRAAK